MEKFCEFCSALRPLVYCKADAAHLCLSCDAKVHSANTLFNRHHRTVLCDSCRFRPAYVQCLGHQMFMCHVCDRRLHKSSQHQKQAISSYTGCPSAKDFAALWGFKLNEVDSSAHLEQTLSTSCGVGDSNVLNLDIHGQPCSHIEGLPTSQQQNYPTLVLGSESQVGSTGQQYKISREGQDQKSTCFILHQILELKRLQLTEGNGTSLLIRGQEQSELSSSVVNHTSNRSNDNLDQHLQHFHNLGTMFQQRDSLLQDHKVDPLPFPISQLEHLPSSSTFGLPLHTESFLQYRNPVQSSQLWSQNMQDLWVCEDLVCQDDFNIPDVDLTFRNFEELFGGDQDSIRALLDHKDAYSSVQKDMSLDKSENGQARATDASEASSIYINQSAGMDKDTGHSNYKAQNIPGSMDSPCPIRPSSSTMMSFGISRFSADGSGADCHGNRLSCDLEGGHLEVRANAMMKYKEKKHSRLLEKQIPYLPGKATIDVHKQVKGRFVKTEDYDSNSDSNYVTRSY